jgi:glycosyltransferase involved in cell wall biosynthesis
MRILIVTPFDIHATGGVSTSVKMLCDEFTARGHQVAILTPGDRVRPEMSSRYGAAAIFRAYLRIPYVPNSPLLGLLAFAIYLPVTLLALWRFLGRHRIDIVSVQYPSAWNLYFGLLRPVSRWKLIVTFLGNDAHDLPSAGWVDRTALRLLLRRADHVTAVSHSLVRTLRRALPGLEFDSSVIHTGAPRTERSGGAVPPPGAPCADYILNVGQLIDRKGVDLIVRALSVMVRDGADARLVLAGDGPARANLEQMVERLGLHSRVFFLGDQGHEAVLALLRGASFFVLGSRAEGLPLVVLEAMMCGAAVVASDVDGVGEVVVDGVTGLLVPPEDVEGLAKAMLRLHQDAGLRKALAAAGADRVRREFTWDVIAARYLDLFGRLSSGSPPTT